MKKRIATIVLISLFAVGLFAHITWMRIDNGKLTVGNKAVLKISHGHDFPGTGSSLTPTSIKTFVRDSSGKITKLSETAQHKGFNSVEYTPWQEGLYTFYIEFGPIIRSKTTRGWKKGSTDEYPKALDSFCKTEYSIIYARTTGAKWETQKPLGIKLELIPKKIGQTIELQLLLDGKPVENTDIEITTIKGEIPGGKTDKDGIYKYKLPTNFNSEIIFSANIKKDAPKGANYKIEFLTVNTLIDLR